ncbi:MAG: DUF983 domain-containing protein [Sphingomonadaceae bacterium]|nr:DUF983 domain-containing protein [Sphingomonadaceae bacterium]
MTRDNLANGKGRQDIFLAALSARCPRCGAPGLFDSMIGFAPACRGCGYDFQKANVGDGPAALLILIVGGLLVAGAVTLQLAVRPPWWVHLLLWVPLIIAATIASLRLSKALLLHAEYRHDAGEAVHGGEDNG